MWQAETKVNGEWLLRAKSTSKFVASLALTQDQLQGKETRLMKFSVNDGCPGCQHGINVLHSCGK